MNKNESKKLVSKWEKDFKKQDGQCPICGRYDDLMLDFDEKKQQYRGCICRRCWRGLFWGCSRFQQGCKNVEKFDKHNKKQK